MKKRTYIGILLLVIIAIPLCVPASSALKPDLRIPQIGYTSWLTGYKAWANINNNGYATAYLFSTLFVLDYETEDETVLGIKGTLILTAGDTKRVYSNEFTTGGEHELYVETDFYDDVDESNENNNIFRYTFDFG